MKRRRLLASALGLAVLLGGCATPQRPAGPVPDRWAGRLALQVEDQPSQSFSAGFELQGSPTTGELSLISPLGSTLALIQWTPARATLTAQSRTTEFESLDALLAKVAGAPIPVRALFDWLAGRPATVPGWEADLSGAADGRISARRMEPPPKADLRIVLEQ
jgi:outer membrane lipoprotein LolB